MPKVQVQGWNQCIRCILRLVVSYVTDVVKAAAVPVVTLAKVGLRPRFADPIVSRRARQDEDDNEGLVSCTPGDQDGQ